MEKKLILTSDEYKDLQSYCKLNNLSEDDIISKSFKEGYRIEKYGLLNNKGKIVEKEVIKEVVKLVEVPVEIEKEVVKVEYVEIEKPVEIIKEVEKIVEVEKIFQDNTKIEQLTQDFSTKTQEMERIFQNEKEQLLKRIDELGQGKIVEVPIEVIREVIVEKNNDENSKPKLDALQSTVQKLRQQIIDKDKKINELENTILDIQKFQSEKKSVYLTGSNLDKTLKK